MLYSSTECLPASTFLIPTVHLPILISFLLASSPFVESVCAP
jgi:hypothetical protein